MHRSPRYNQTNARSLRPAFYVVMTVFHHSADENQLNAAPQTWRQHENPLITLPIFLVLNACGKSDDDTGAADESFVTNNGMSAEDDGGGDDGGGDDGGGSTDGGGDDGGFEVMNSSPGCIATGACATRT